jgi:hypothetical protein
MREFSDVLKGRKWGNRLRPVIAKNSEPYCKTHAYLCALLHITVMPSMAYALAKEKLGGGPDEDRPLSGYRHPHPVITNEESQLLHEVGFALRCDWKHVKCLYLRRWHLDEDWRKVRNELLKMRAEQEKVAL